MGSGHLELVCSKLLDLLHEHNYQETPGLSSLWGAGTTSCINNEKLTERSMIEYKHIVLLNTLNQGSLCCSDTGSVLASALHISQRSKELHLSFQHQPKVNLCRCMHDAFFVPWRPHSPSVHAGNLISARQISGNFNVQVYRSPLIYEQLEKVRAEN